MDQASTAQRLLETASRRLLTVSIIVTPWLLGGSEPWAHILLSGFIATSGILWMMSLLCSQSPRLHAPLVSALLLCLVVAALVQITPLPASVIRILSPFAQEQIDQTRATMESVNPPHEIIEHVSLTDLPYTVSVSPSSTSRSIYLLLVYIICFLVMANTIHSWKQLKSISMAIVLGGTAMAFVGIIHKFSGSHNILWIHTPREHGIPFGAFTNRNHFAAYTNMITGLALGLFFASREFVEIMGARHWRDRLSWLSSRGASALALFSFMIVLLAGSVCLSKSRGGMLSLAICMIAFGFITGWRRRELGRTRVALLAASFLIGAAILWLGRGEMLERLTTLSKVVQNPMEDLRTIVTLDTLSIFSAAPLLGTGFGTFRYVHSMFQTPDLDLRWLHAHNDWAQLLAEGGILSTIVFIAALIAWIKIVTSKYKYTSTRPKMLMTGMFIGLSTIALHSLIDYSLHKPANACLLAGMAGMTVSCCRLLSRRLSDSQIREAARVPFTISPTAIKVISLVAVLGLCAMLITRQAELRSELAFTRFLYLKRLSATVSRPEDTQRIADQAYREAERVLLHSRRNPDAMNEMSRALLVWTMNPLLDRPFRIRQMIAAYSSAALAAHSAPTNYLGWLYLARALMSISYWDQADLCLQRARELVRHPDQVKMFDIPDYKPPNMEGNTDT